ncbi:MAG: acetyl-CoA carboxylase, carboxyltransferase subunit beta [Candidatus Margulisiibacteriota bacterium]|jgi:acetyl-CoA carboxylase carboxyl transferase subunit beta
MSPSLVDFFKEKKKGVLNLRLDIPSDLWVKCVFCNEILYKKQLRKNLNVCPHCGHHFRLSFKERIDLVCDKGSFVEEDKDVSSVDFLGFKDQKKYQDRIEENKKKSGMTDAIVTGECTIGGQKAQLGLMDFSFMGGSMGSVVGEKITRAMEKAIAKKIPMVMFTVSGGARMQEGVMSLMQMAKTSAAAAKMKENGILYVVVLTDPTTGGTTASFAMLGDIHLAEPGALIGFAGPRVIEQTIRQKLPKNFQRAEYLQEHGMVDKVVPRKDLKQVLTNILRWGA